MIKGERLVGETSRRHRQFYIFLRRVTLYNWSYCKFDEKYLYYTHEGSWCGKNITTLITTLAYQTVVELGTLHVSGRRSAFML